MDNITVICLVRNSICSGIMNGPLLMKTTLFQGVGGLFLVFESFPCIYSIYGIHYHTHSGHVSLNLVYLFQFLAHCGVRCPCVVEPQPVDHFAKLQGVPVSESLQSLRV